MTAIREEELNMINGGVAPAGLIGGAKFNVGDKVIVKSAPDGGIGTVVKITMKEYEDYMNSFVRVDIEELRK